MKELIEYLAKALVDHPEEVELTEVHGDRTVILELRCHREDVGKLIGKSGKTIGALRTLLSTVAARTSRKAILEVVE